MTWYWAYAIRTSTIFAWKVFTGIYWSICNRLVQQKKNEKKTMCFSYGNAWPLLTFSRACGRWGRVFATTNSASLRPWTKKNWLSHPFPLLMAVSMLLNVLHSSTQLLHAAFAADTILGRQAWTSSYQARIKTPVPIRSSSKYTNVFRYVLL